MNEGKSLQKITITHDDLEVVPNRQLRSEINAHEGRSTGRGAGNFTRCNCGKDNPVACKFCVQCGARLAVKSASYSQASRGLALPASLIVGALLFLILGLTRPAFTTLPSLGGGVVEWWINIFTDEVTAKTFSILGGIRKLFSDGDFLIAMILVSFSVVFPMTKSFLLLLIVGNEGGLLNLSRALSANLKDNGIKYASYLGKYSMVDVMVISIIVVAFKGFPGGTKVVAEVGLYCFAIQVVLSMVGTHCLKRYLDSARAASNTV